MYRHITPPTNQGVVLLFKGEGERIRMFTLIVMLLFLVKGHHRYRHITHPLSCCTAKCSGVTPVPLAAYLSALYREQQVSIIKTVTSHSSALLCVRVTTNLYPFPTLK